LFVFLMHFLTLVFFILAFFGIFKLLNLCILYFAFCVLHF
jgi:hypothetical protein